MFHVVSFFMASRCLRGFCQQCPDCQHLVRIGKALCCRGKGIDTGLRCDASDHIGKIARDLVRDIGFSGMSRATFEDAETLFPLDSVRMTSPI